MKPRASGLKDAYYKAHGRDVIFQNWHKRKAPWEVLLTCDAVRADDNSVLKTAQHVAIDVANLLNGS